MESRGGVTPVIVLTSPVQTGTLWSDVSLLFVFRIPFVISRFVWSLVQDLRVQY